MNVAPPSHDESHSKVDSLDSSLQTSRCLTILDSSYFSFENFEDRAPLACCLDVVALTLCMRQNDDKVRQFLQNFNSRKIHSENANYC